ncbi:SDR family oxidoreductase [Streptomyces sp. NPDC050428]|uniref:SDR family oxidoreductase n=1 Tax=Streptomyces sp. NPDC050428 TaxID=3155757 RepID=UPI003444BDE4
MTSRTWLITGASSGFGHALTTQLLQRGDTVIGTVRNVDKVAALAEKYPDTFRPEILDVTDTTAVRKTVDAAFEAGRVDVIVSNAGYGLLGAAEEITDDQVDHIIATNLTGSITLIRAAMPHLRAQGSGRIIQMSTYGGQVAFPGNSMYHAAKWGIEGFAESVAQEVAPFNIGVTIVEPGGARTEFRYGSAQVRRPDRRLRRQPRPRLPRHARPGQRPRPRRPAAYGRPHHRVRRHRARPAADGARLPGAGFHPRCAAQADRGLRGPARPGGLHGLPRRRVTPSRNPGSR